MFEQTFLGRVRLAQGYSGKSEFVYHCANETGQTAVLESAEHAAVMVSRGWSCYKKLRKIPGVTYPEGYEAWRKQMTEPYEPPPTPTPTQSRMPTNVPQYSWNNQVRDQYQGVASGWSRSGIPTMPLANIFNQGMTAAPLSMAPAATSYGNYAGTW